MDTNTFMSAAALAVSFIAAVGPTTWAIIRYYKDKQVEYARKAADTYYKALTKANCLDTPLDGQELAYASLMLEAAIGHKDEIDIAKMAIIKYRDAPTGEMRDKKAKAVGNLLAVIGEAIKS